MSLPQQSNDPNSAAKHIPSLPVSLAGEGHRMAIVVARFNSHITEPLLVSAYKTFTDHGVKPEHITVVWVPGAFELPLVSHKIAASNKFSAVLALGCVIRGETTHYDYVCNESARGINEASLKTGVPVLFGVLTTENLAQAEARAGFNGGENKGVDVALAALEMANLHRDLDRHILF